MYKGDVFLLLKPFQLSMETLQVIQLDLFSMYDLDAEIFFYLFYECRNLFQELLQVFRHGLFPDKFVFIGKSFNLSAVNEDIFQGKFTKVGQTTIQLSGGRFQARCQMYRTESVNCGIVWRPLTFKLDQVVDMPSTGLFDLA